MEFKVGDKVIVTGDTAETFHEVKPGSEAIVISVSPLREHGVVRVLPIGEDEDWAVHVRDLQVIKILKEVVESQTDDPIRRQLWCDVYMSTLTLNYKFSYRMEQCAEALEEYDKRFKL